MTVDERKTTLVSTKIDNAVIEWVQFFGIIGFLVFFHFYLWFFHFFTACFVCFVCFLVPFHSFLVNVSPLPIIKINEKWKRHRWLRKYKCTFRKFALRKLSGRMHRRHTERNETHAIFSIPLSCPNLPSTNSISWDRCIQFFEKAFNEEASSSMNAPRQSKNVCVDLELAMKIATLLYAHTHRDILLYRSND